MIFSILAFVALFVSICIKDRKKSLYVQSLNCFFWSDIWLYYISFYRSNIKYNKFNKDIYIHQQRKN